MNLKQWVHRKGGTYKDFELLSFNAKIGNNTNGRYSEVSQVGFSWILTVLRDVRDP